MTIVTTDAALRDRGLALALTASCLGRRVEPLLDDDHLTSLIDTVSRVDAIRFGDALVALDHWRGSARTDAATLTGRWVRWFDLGRLPPYEGSNVVLSAGGVTPRLAEVAGDHLVFGMHVHQNRPDHIVAELEFLAFTTMLEADARAVSDESRAGIAADAARSFVRDHIGTWIRAWSERVAAETELAPWHPVASLAADLVDHEARVRNVVPLLTASPTSVHDDDIELACGLDS